MTTALYRRYRPDTFQDVIGQEHVTAPLMAALRADRVTHAYLFSGPRGCGKTTSARILARCLNCENGPTDTPCGTCPSCRDLATGGPGSLDVVEIDAASHNGVDDARDLRERAAFAPARDRYKVFILDEAHMVTAQGFNALLKLVEEPPAHVKFIFATTEPEKVIGTIRSRTHHYPFRLVPPDVLEGYLGHLCDAEGVQVGAGVFPLVVRAGGGSVRDTLSVMDQLIGGAVDGSVDYQRAVALLGYTDTTLLDHCVDALAGADGAGVFRVVDRVVESGHDPRRFVEDFLQRLRDLLVIALAGAQAGPALGSLPEDQLARMEVQARVIGPAPLSRAADLTAAALTGMVGATSPRLQLELLMARLLVPTAGPGGRPRTDGAGPVPAGATGQGEGPVGLGLSSSSTAQGGRGHQPTSGGPTGVHAAREALARATGTHPSEGQSGRTSSSVHADGGAGRQAPPADDAGEATPQAGQAPTGQASAGESPAEQRPAAQTGSGVEGTDGPGAGATSWEAAPSSADSGAPSPGQESSDPYPTSTVKDGEPAGPSAAPTATAPDTVPGGHSGRGPEQRTPAGESGPAAAGAAEAEMIRARWEEVLDAARRSRRATWALVSPNAQPGALRGGVFDILFTAPGLVGAFERGGHGEVMSAALHQALGLNLEVHAVLAGGPGPDAGHGGPAPDPVPRGRDAAHGKGSDHRDHGELDAQGSPGDAPRSESAGPRRSGVDDGPAPRAQSGTDTPARGRTWAPESPSSGRQEATPPATQALVDDGWGPVAVPGAARAATPETPGTGSSVPSPAAPAGGASPDRGGQVPRTDEWPHPPAAAAEYATHADQGLPEPLAHPGAGEPGDLGHATGMTPQATARAVVPSPESPETAAAQTASTDEGPASGGGAESGRVGSARDVAPPSTASTPAEPHLATVHRLHPLPAVSSTTPPAQPDDHEVASAPLTSPGRGEDVGTAGRPTPGRRDESPAPTRSAPPTASGPAALSGSSMAGIPWDGPEVFSDGVPLPEEPGDPERVPEDTASTWGPGPAAGSRMAAAIAAARAAAAEGAGPGGAAASSLEDDLPSEDDPDAEEAGVVGLEVVKQILGATVLEDVVVTEGSR